MVLAVLGVLLRYMQLYGLPGFNYQFLLHGHSHFAFAGWTFFALAFLLSDLPGHGRSGTAFKAVLILTLLCSYGMLGSFSLQGYKAVPIFFSTVFILITWWFSYLLLKGEAFKNKLPAPARKLISGAVFCLCISSLGPFALGPLMAGGLKGSVIYQDAIYFYLHFQMNGWMLPAALGLFVTSYLQNSFNSSGMNLWLNAFVWSAIPLYFIFTLWTGSGWWFNALAFTGSVMHLVSWIKLYCGLKEELNGLPVLVKASLMAITLKAVFQVLVCFPVIDDWAFLNRNLIIGYVHLITLGCVTPLIFDQFARRGYIRKSPAVAAVNGFYLSLVILYLVLLFVQPLLALFGLSVPYFQVGMLGISAVFVMAGLFYLLNPKGQDAVSAL